MQLADRAELADLENSGKSRFQIDAADGSEVMTGKRRTRRAYKARGEAACHHAGSQSYRKSCSEPYVQSDAGTDAGADVRAV